MYASSNPMASSENCSGAGRPSRSVHGHAYFVRWYHLGSVHGGDTGCDRVTIRRWLINNRSTNSFVGLFGFEFLAKRARSDFFLPFFFVIKREDFVQQFKLGDITRDLLFLSLSLSLSQFFILFFH